MLENRMVIDNDLYIENDADSYEKYCNEEDDRRYEDKIFERINEE